MRCWDNLHLVSYCDLEHRNLYFTANVFQAAQREKKKNTEPRVYESDSVTLEIQQDTVHWPNLQGLLELTVLGLK